MVHNQKYHITELAYSDSTKMSQKTQNKRQIHMKKLSIDMLNAYPTVSQEELMEIKGGVLPVWVAWVVAGSTVAAAVATIYQAITSGNIPQTPSSPSSPPPQLTPEQMHDLIKDLIEKGVRFDSLTRNGLFGADPTPGLFYGNGSGQSNSQGIPYRK